MRNYIMYINVSRETWRSYDLSIIISILLSPYYSYYSLLLFYYIFLFIYLYLHLVIIFFFTDIFTRSDLHRYVLFYVSYLASLFISIIHLFIYHLFIPPFHDCFIHRGHDHTIFLTLFSLMFTLFSLPAFTWDKFQRWLRAKSIR